MNQVDKLVGKLLSQRWTSFNQGKPNVKNLQYPGVYLLAYSNKNLEGRRINVKKNEVFYVGMSNSLGGVGQRLKQFEYAIKNGKRHAGGNTFFWDKKYMGGKPYDESKTRKKFFVATLSIECEVRKEDRKKKHLRKMGHVACLELYVMAHIKEETKGEEPELNKK